jgi:hypothetical protein
VIEQLGNDDAGGHAGMLTGARPVTTN